MPEHGKAQEKLKEQKSSKPKTKEEIQNQRLADITSLSNGLKQAETVESVKSRVDGGARALESEIELDRMHDVSEKAIAEKETELSAMKEKSAQLTAAIGDKISEVTEKMKENSQISISEEEPNESLPAHME